MTSAAGFLCPDRTIEWTGPGVTAFATSVSLRPPGDLRPLWLVAAGFAVYNAAGDLAVATSRTATLSWGQAEAAIRAQRWPIFGPVLAQQLTVVFPGDGWLVPIADGGVALRQLVAEVAAGGTATETFRLWAQVSDVPLRLRGQQ